MKKYLSIWIPALAVLLVVSCGGKSTKTLDEAAENADSVMVESQQEPEPPVVKVKGELGLFDLQGPVKSCTLKNQWGKVSRTFNEQGLWQTYNGKPLSKVYSNGIERDEQGRIVKGKMDSAGNGDEYEYNADGTRKRYYFHYGDESTEEIDIRDTDGKLISTKKTEISFDTDGEPYTETYEILSTDDYGNWTKRKVKVNGGAADTHTRIIEYYK